MAYHMPFLLAMIFIEKLTTVSLPYGLSYYSFEIITIVRVEAVRDNICKKRKKYLLSYLCTWNLAPTQTPNTYLKSWEKNTIIVRV